MLGMKIIVWACIVAQLCCCTLAQSHKSNVMVDIEPKGETVVKLGEKLEILCRAESPLHICRVEIPGEKSMVLTEDQPPEDGIEYYGDGLMKHHCGVRIARVREIHDGLFKCHVLPEKARFESTASVRIIVAKSPNNPILYTSPGSYNRNIYRSGEKLEISCSAPAGRPPANVSLYLDNEPIDNFDRSTFYDSNINESSLAVHNATRSLLWSDNGKTLRCLASHIALERPKETGMQLQVYYPPQPPPQPSIERFGYVIGRPGTVNVTVWANPKPHFLWRVNNENIAEGRQDESKRLEASAAMDLGRGAWSVILTIDNVQKSDTEKEYILNARNEEGTYEYRIVLSTSTEPAGVELDAGSIIGIVVGALVLILAVFLIIFARATGRWCFAGGARSRNLGESELADAAARINLLRINRSKTITNDASLKRSDTESAGRYSRSEVDGARRPRRPKINLTRIFKRNKDKVSGADTDTMRTVVTVDDEKPIEPSQEGKNHEMTGTGEGGIVYAELDLTQQQQGLPPRRLNEDKTEYAEILYTKTEDGAADDQHLEKLQSTHQTVDK
ncbi:fasciclin-3 isoform X2 [Prorops nasuta]|uniref:fasciclin-3 isoform X2 n=1 Tax=Prorops nasuta TaxID=863751 RepID=UPI0034CF3260